MKDPFFVLGLPRTASPDEVKKAFRKLALMHHPDRPGGNAEKFKELSTAYAEAQKISPSVSLPPHYSPHTQFNFDAALFNAQLSAAEAQLYQRMQDIMRNKTQANYERN